MEYTTTFNDLCADLLLNIFEFFTLNEIYYSFHEVIPYLTSLLVNSKARLRMCDLIIPEVQPTIVASLELQYLSRSSSPLLSDFINLRSLVLHDMEDPWLIINQNFAESLERLYLNISLRNKNTIIAEFLSFVFRLSKLKYFTIIYPSSYFIIQEDSFILPKLSTTIESLKLDVKCSMLCLDKLLKYLPSIRHLHATVAFTEENIEIYSRASVFPTVQYLFLSWEYIPIQDVIRFCQTMPCLRQCTLDATDYRDDQDLFYPNTWQQFIEHDHSMLKKFQVNMTRKPSHDFHRNSHWLSLNHNPYFREINFKFKMDNWGNTILNGNYAKLRYRLHDLRV
ncbi:unnamed protein product [Rotaria sp. Silwood1]|nr:unnamed protein product [Rotaria sp. Silwood1]